METYYHGSSSASFVGVLNENSPRLKPFGTIFSEGKAPYCGELWQGISKNGISWNSISAVEQGAVKIAINHASNISEGWNPKVGIEKIMQLKKGIKELEQEIENGEDTKLFSHVVEMYKMRKKVEERRLRNWKSLSNTEKDIVENPYPVIYRIKYNGVINHCLHDSREVRLPEIEIDNLTVYVPEKYLSSTNFLFDRHKSVVKPFDALRELQNLPLDCRTSIEILVCNSKGIRFDLIGHYDKLKRESMKVGV
ncbi:MAG: hypothetical protein Q8N63_06925 [Nanoarchaeota archaeon]|nr:hypothetical protein [Nanoarchaeota archaeon]